jgi:hypothetical protein
VTLEVVNINANLSGDSPSRAIGTKALLAHDLVPDVLPASRKGLAEQQAHHIKRVGYLIVDQSVNRRITPVLPLGPDVAIACLRSDRLTISKSAHLYSPQAIS